MIGNTYSTRLVLPVAVAALLACSAAHAGQPVTAHPRLVEVFTTTQSSVASLLAINRQSVSGEMDLHVYDLDGIRSIESQLSEDLTADPEQAKRVVLQRIQHMGDQSKTKMQSAAQGLAKAMQYGVDRYPAIVFDGQAVVYGVTDVGAALAHYRTWRREGKR